MSSEVERGAREAEMVEDGIESSSLIDSVEKSVRSMAHPNRSFTSFAVALDYKNEHIRPQPTLTRRKKAALK